MFKVTVTLSFSAAHSLRNYKGKCENMHGHNWKVEVVVSSPDLNSMGMIMDFCDLKNMSTEVVSELDHKDLNTLTYFKDKNPSSEEIARYIFLKLKEDMHREQGKLEEVRVWETDTSCALYSE